MTSLTYAERFSSYKSWARLEKTPTEPISCCRISATKWCMFSADVERFLVIDRFYQVARTNEDDMVVQLALILAFAIKLRHLLERVEHSLHDLLISDIDSLTDLECVGPDQLLLDAADVDGEVFDELSNTVAFLARQFRILD